jgi:hypothetical protein
MEREWIGARTMISLVGALLVAAGCGGRNGLNEAPCEVDADCVSGVCDASGTCKPATGEDVQAVRPCVLNADCDDQSVCFDGTCRFVGECTMDVHCTCSAPVCEANACVGEPACGSSFVFGAGEQAPPPPPPPPCQINADCGEKQYCFDGACHTTIECLKHAHCAAKEGCFQHLCWPL